MESTPKTLLRSGICSQQQLESKEFQDWAELLGEYRNHLHRKIWEWCFVTQALFERGLLESGKSGLGFAVGQEPLSALFCSLGASICGTDLFPDVAKQRGWVESNQHASSLESMNSRGICDFNLFRQRCSLQFADMNYIPDNLREFDFVWSSCALEHLGSLEHGFAFVRNAMDCLKRGGVAVHTTDFNLSSNDATLCEGETVFYRRRDIEELAKKLRTDGFSIDVDWSVGTMAADLNVDTQPLTHNPHLRLEIGQYIVTSMGFIISKPA